MIKAGVIGLGVGEHHARAAASHSGCVVAALCDLDGNRLSEVSKQHANAYLTDDADRIFLDPHIDLVCIASYDDAHVGHVMTALQQGKHVFVEKPMCLSGDEMSQIYSALQERPELRLSSNLGLRSCPRFSGVREAVQSGEMGDVYHMEGEYLWGRKVKLTDGWRKDIPFYSIILGAAVHMVDLLLWTTGTLPVSVRGVGNNIATRNSELRYNDFAAFFLEYENGMTAKVAAHGGCVHPHFHRFVVHGTQKTFMNDLSGALWLDSSDPTVSPVPDKRAYPARKERDAVILSFIDSLNETSQNPLVAEKDVFDCMAVCIAAEEAIRTNQNIQIDYAL